MVYKSKSLRTITNIYLVNLAVADSLYLLYSCTVNLAIYFWSPFKENRGFYPDNHGSCISEQIILVSTFYASLFLIFIVSIERYLAICRPLKHRALASKRRTWTICVVTWLVAIVCTFPTILTNGYHTAACYKYSITGIAVIIENRNSERGN